MTQSVSTCSKSTDISKSALVRSLQPPPPAPTSQSNNTLEHQIQLLTRPRAARSCTLLRQLCLVKMNHGHHRPSYASHGRLTMGIQGQMMSGPFSLPLYWLPPVSASTLTDLGAARTNHGLRRAQRRRRRVMLSPLSTPPMPTTNYDHVMRISLSPLLIPATLATNHYHMRTAAATNDVAIF
jgi:hypothetical protein